MIDDKQSDHNVQINNYLKERLDCFHSSKYDDCAYCAEKSYVKIWRLIY